MFIHAKLFLCQVRTVLGLPNYKNYTNNFKNVKTQASSAIHKHYVTSLKT